MKLTTSVSLVFAVAIEALVLIPCTCSALALINSSSPSTVTVRASSTNEAFHHVVTRRSAAFSVIGCVFAAPGLALAADELNVAAAAATQEDVLESEAAKVEAAKERMRQRIAESKKSYRKPTDLVKQRKDTTDYSCVSDTGSPCPEGLVPRAVQREIVKALEKLEE